MNRVSAITAWLPDPILAAITLVGFALRIAWIATTSFTPTLSDDAGRYDLLGRSIANNAGFINPNGTTTMFWPPGYPFILAAVYKLYPRWLLADHTVGAALVVNALLGAATIVLVYAIAARAFDRRTALIAAAIVAAFPSLIFFAGVTLSETAFTFFLLLALWLIVRNEHRDPRLTIATGIVIGCASLIRGQALLLPLVAAPFWWRSAPLLPDAWRQTLVPVAATAALALVVIAPWTIRNYRESHALVPIASNSGVDLYIGHSAGANGAGRIVDELVFRYPDLPPPEAEAKVSSDGFRKGVNYAIRHPLREVRLSAQKAYWLYYRDDEAVRWIDGHGERHVLAHTTRNALAAISNLYYYALIALAAVGARRWLSLHKPMRLLLVTLVAYWTLVHIAFFGDPRFHAPIMPVLALWAACGVTVIWERLRPRAEAN